MHSDPGDKTALRACSLGQLLSYFVKLGALGFGGPIALTGAMQRDLVDRERWISLQEYKEGLALSQLAPGPLAAQLAIYLGWTRFPPLLSLRDPARALLSSHRQESLDRRVRRRGDGGRNRSHRRGCGRPWTSEPSRMCPVL
jgi:hypothetical protein